MASRFFPAMTSKVRVYGMQIACVLTRLFMSPTKYNCDIYIFNAALICRPMSNIHVPEYLHCAVQRPCKGAETQLYAALLY